MRHPNIHLFRQRHARGGAGADKKRWCKEEEEEDGGLIALSLPHCQKVRRYSSKRATLNW